MHDSNVFHKISEHVLEQSIKALEIRDGLLENKIDSADAQEKLSKLANDLTSLAAQVSTKGDQFIWLYNRPETVSGVTEKN
jgi:hypothetical protein